MSRGKRTVYSLVIAIGMLLFSYWVTNQRYLVSGNALLIKPIEIIKSLYYPSTNYLDSVLLINTSYDQVLVAVNQDNRQKGYDQMADRRKLLQLLTELKRRNDYKYIILDINFSDEADYHSDVDSALFDLIMSMDNIVIPKTPNMRLADERLNIKAGYAMYFTSTFHDSFTKYPFIVNGQKSLPLKMYEEITGRKVESEGLFSTEGCRLVLDNIVLPPKLKLDLEDNEFVEYLQNGNKVWRNLGADLLGCYNNDTSSIKGEIYDTPALTRDKYIVIGAITGNTDRHNTCIGDQPGAIINFNAYLALFNNNHYIYWDIAILMFISFLFLSWCTISTPEERKKWISLYFTDNKFFRKCKKYMNSTFPRLSRRLGWLNKIINFLNKHFGTWFDFSLFLIVLFTCTYLIRGVVYDIFITATVFALIKVLNELFPIFRNKIKGLFIKLKHIKV